MRNDGKDDVLITVYLEIESIRTIHTALPKLVENSKAQGAPIIGILLTPESTHRPYGADILADHGEYREWG